MLRQTAGDRDLPMQILRWWFTLDYGAVRTNADRNVFQWAGPGVRVLSENELLTERGERIHTGESDLLNAEFAHSFTKHFDALAAKYPVYAELRNVFELAMLCAILRSEDLPASRLASNAFRRCSCLPDRPGISSPYRRKHRECRRCQPATIRGRGQWRRLRGCAQSSIQGYHEGRHVRPDGRRA